MPPEAAIRRLFSARATGKQTTMKKYTYFAGCFELRKSPNEGGPGLY
jgi:hypothetical protein